MANMPVATLRIWEQRYQAVHPATAASGHRLYSPADVQRVLMLRQLTEQGHAIGTLAVVTAGGTVKRVLPDIPSNRDAWEVIRLDEGDHLIGAIHLDGGPAASRAFLRRLFIPAIEDAIPRLHLFDAKTALKEICERDGSGHPRYEWTASGPDHERVFDVVVLVGGRVVGRGSGTTKKSAEQAAAAEAVEALGPSPGA